MIRFVLIGLLLTFLNSCGVYSKRNQHDSPTYSFIITCHKDLKGVLNLYDGCKKIKRKRINYHRERFNIQHDFDTLIVRFKNYRDTIVNINNKKFYEIYISKEGIKSYVFDEAGFPI